MITNSINAYLFLDGVKFLSLILLTISVKTSCLGKDGNMFNISKLTIVSSSSSFTFLVSLTNCSTSSI